jgi:hypothetical protein
MASRRRTSTEELLRTVIIEMGREFVGLLHPDSKLQTGHYVPNARGRDADRVQDIPEELREHILEELQKGKVSGQFGEFRWREETDPSDKRHTIR